MWVNSHASGFCAAAGLEPRLALGPGHGPLNLPLVHRRRAGHPGLIDQLCGGTTARCSDGLLENRRGARLEIGVAAVGHLDRM